VPLGGAFAVVHRAGQRKWWRILLRLWGGALASGDRYLAQVHERSADTAMLALIAIWMERTSEARYPGGASA
jgi:hypothetical protein